MKRKLLIVILSALAALCLALCFSACGNEESYSGWTYTEGYIGSIYTLKITSETESPNGNINDSGLHKSNEKLKYKEEPYKLSPDGVYYLVLDIQFFDFSFSNGDKFTIEMWISGVDKLNATLQDAATGIVEERKEGHATAIRTTFTPPQNIESEKIYRIVYKVRMMGDSFVSANFRINDLKPSDICTFGEQYGFSVGNDGFCSLYSINDRTIQEFVVPSYCGMYPTSAIGGYLFQKCTNLKSITIPKSVTSVGREAFADTAYYNTADNWTDGVLYIDDILIKAGGTLTGNYNIRQGTKVIADEAFGNCKDLKSIKIPDSVIYIGKWAFLDIDLESVTFENATRWKVSENKDMSNADDVTISGDPAENAILLTGYNNYYWRR